MITDAILTALLGGLSALLGLAPVITIPDLQASSIVTAIAAATGFVPVAAMVTMLLAYLAVMVGMQGWELVAFVYHQFWGSD